MIIEQTNMFITNIFTAISGKYHPLNIFFHIPHFVSLPLNRILNFAIAQFYSKFTMKNKTGIVTDITLNFLPHQNEGKIGHNAFQR